jgi:hypothetical protein
LVVAPDAVLVCRSPRSNASRSPEGPAGRPCVRIASSAPQQLIFAIGYALALTAAGSEDELGRGRRFCDLVADPDNPTSSSIDGAIGYRPA